MDTTEQDKRSGLFADAAAQGYLKVKSTKEGRQAAEAYLTFCEEQNIPYTVLTSYRTRSDLLIDIDPLPGDIDLDSTVQAQVFDFVESVRKETKTREFGKAEFTGRKIVAVRKIPSTVDDMVAREVSKIIYTAKGVTLGERMS